MALGTPCPPLYSLWVPAVSSVVHHLCYLSFSLMLLPIFSLSFTSPIPEVESQSFPPPPQITPRVLVAVMVWRRTRWTKQQWGSTTRARWRSMTLRKVSLGSQLQQPCQDWGLGLSLLGPCSSVLGACNLLYVWWNAKGTVACPMLIMLRCWLQVFCLQEEGGLLMYTPVESSGLAPCLSSSLSKSWAGKTTCFCENSLCSQFYHYSLSLHSLFASIPWSGSPWLKTILRALVGSLGSRGIDRTRVLLAGTIRRKYNPMHPKQVYQCCQRWQHNFLEAHVGVELPVRTWQRSSWYKLNVYSILWNCRQVEQLRHCELPKHKDKLCQSRV